MTYPNYMIGEGAPKTEGATGEDEFKDAETGEEAKQQELCFYIWKVGNIF